MMEKPFKRKTIDYGEFKNPYTGLGAMIFLQADYDLHKLGGKEFRVFSWGVMSKAEIMQFLDSDWAKTLAAEIGLEQVDLDNYVRAYT